MGAAGGLYLPGAEIPGSAVPLQVIVEVDSEDARSVQLVGAGGELLAEVQDRVIEADLDLAAGEAVYARVVLDDGEEEHRIWISPWFGGD